MMPKQVFLFALSSVALSIAAGCGGSNGSDNDNGGGGLPIPTGTVRFSDATPDYTGGSDDILASEGTVLSDATTYAVNVEGSSRTLYIAFPAASATENKTLAFNGSVTGASATYSVVLNGSLTRSRWEAKAGTVTLISKTPTRALFRLNGLFFRPVTGSTGAGGTFTLNGTILGVPVQN